MTDDTGRAAPLPATQEPPQNDGAPQPGPVPVAGLGALGAGLIGGAVAAVIGMAIVGPLLRRRKAKQTAKPAPSPRPRRRKPPSDA